MFKQSSLNKRTCHLTYIVFDIELPSVKMTSDLWKIDSSTILWPLTSRLWCHNAGARELSDNHTLQCMTTPSLIGSQPSVALFVNGPLTRYVKLRVAHAPGMPGTFSPPPRDSDPDLHHGTCVTHVPCCRPGSLTSGFLWSQWRGKRSRHSWRMCNSQFYVSGKRSMEGMAMVSSNCIGKIFQNAREAKSSIYNRITKFVDEGLK